MKPKLTYAEFVAAQRKKPTLGELMTRYMAEMEKIKPVGESQTYAMRAIARRAIGARVAAELTHNDFIAYGRGRIEDDKVAPSTVTHDLSDISVVMKYAGAAWPDCEGLTAAPILAAKPFMAKHGYMGKSSPRERRPTADELGSLIDHFNTPAKKGHARRIPMALLTVWQVASGRRISETCRLLWSDWNREERTVLVRKMKDPRTRDKNKLVALTVEAQALLEQLWEVRDENEPRIFPYRARSVVSAYCNAKKRTGIDGLHLHDSRRETGSRLAEAGYTATQIIMVTGHETTHIADRVYIRPRASKFKDGPMGRTLQ